MFIPLHFANLSSYHHRTFSDIFMQLYTTLYILICKDKIPILQHCHKYTYDFSAILTDQIFSRFLAPSSKPGSYSYCQTLLEPPKYELQNINRALSVMAEESDFIQEELYCNSNFVHPRSQKILYYDCTNYYFETTQDDDFRKYGKSKENRPNPIVTMGEFIFCSDAGLGSKSNRRFSSFGNHQPARVSPA